MTIGDVLAVVAAVLAISAAWIATILLASALAPKLTERARVQVEKSPVRCAFIGAIALIAICIPSLAFFGSLVGASRLLPLAVIGLVVCFAAIGSAGIVSVIASRLGESPSSFATRRLAATIYLLAGVFPLAGWFVITPLALMISTGAAVSAMLLGPRTVAEVEAISAPIMGEAV